MSHVIKLTDATFHAEVEHSNVPVLVDYWAPWCGPCHVLSPVVEQIAVEHAGALKVAKVNVDEEPGLAAQAGVQSIPSVVLYRAGRPVAHTVGAQPKHALEDAPDELRPVYERAAPFIAVCRGSHQSGDPVRDPRRVACHIPHPIRVRRDHHGLVHVRDRASYSSSRAGRTAGMCTL